MIATTIRDIDGHVWPVTGLWCDDCGMPLNRVLATAGVHPTCGADS